jgi:hypothetical protein
VTVPAGDGDDPREQIEITPAGLVEEVLHPAFDDHQRIPVQREHGRVGVLAPGGEHLFPAGARVPAGLVVEGGHL